MIHIIYVIISTLCVHVKMNADISFDYQSNTNWFETNLLRLYLIHLDCITSVTKINCIHFTAV